MAKSLLELDFGRGRKDAWIVRIATQLTNRTRCGGRTYRQLVRMPIVLGGIHWRTPAHSLNCLPGMEIGCIRKNAVRIADGAGMVPCRFRRGRFGISSSGVPTVWKPCRPACRPAGKFSSPTRLVTCPSADGESPRKAGRDPLVKAGGRCKKSRQRNC